VLARVPRATNGGGLSANRITQTRTIDAYECRNHGRFLFAEDFVISSSRELFVRGKRMPCRFVLAGIFAGLLDSCAPDCRDASLTNRRSLRFPSQYCEVLKSGVQELHRRGLA
jgi:hypothetical protein